MFEDELDRLSKAGLLRKVYDREPHQGARIVLRGKECINFASNDYLGLAGHPALRKAASEAAEKLGAGAGASRLLAGGTSRLHERLEARLASFKGAPSALLFNSGYAANTGAIPALAGDGDAIFSDELNHASIIDGCRLSRARTHVYKHKDMDHLEGLLMDTESRRKLIVTDTVFSMEGDLSPLKELTDLAGKHNAMLYTDDAHGTGVLGGGRGALAHAGIAHAPHIIQMGTLSKAAGSMGGFVAAHDDIIEWILNKARTFIFSTALAPSSVAASINALELMESEPGLIRKLWENRSRLAGLLEEKGIGTGESETPIIPLRVSSSSHALEVSEALFNRGFYAPAIRPPTVPMPMIRITVTAAHEASDINGLSEALGAHLRTP